MMAALVLVPGVTAGVAAPAWLAGPAWAFLTTTEFDQAEEDRIYVRFLAGYDARSLVRTAAWNALTSTNVPVTVDRFINSGGMAYAVTRSEQLGARNADFARRILATHTEKFAPEVRAAARYALDNGASALETFARTGYAAARQRDRAAREAAGEQATALVDADRNFVAHLRDADPGAQVRAAAGLALSERTDAALVEFYAHDWAAAAAVDLQTQQVQCANSDLVWRAGVKTLLADALAAQKAANEAAQEAREQARAAALRAWQALGEQARPAKSTWDTAVEVAQQQAANWEQVALAAAAAVAADNPNWDAIAGSAQANDERWRTERTNAAKQAAYWTTLYEMALAGERDMQS